MTSLTRRSIGRQSCTQRRTSASTCSSACTISARRAASSIARDMDVDEAFARLVLVVAALRSAAPSSLPALSRVDRQDRMHDQARRQAALGQFGHHRIDQERHVVVDDLDHRDRLEMLAVRRRRLLEADFRRAGLAGGEERPGLAGERREFGGVVADQVLRRGAAEQQRDKIVRHVALVAAQELCGRIDAGARGALLATGTVDDRLLVHVRFKSGESIAPRQDCSGFARQRKGCRLPSTSCGRR